MDLPEIFIEAENRGSSFRELLTVPEQDDWVYTDGKSTSCIAFILEMYKQAGLFDPFSTSIQVTEFTVKFENEISPVVVDDDDDDESHYPCFQMQIKDAYTLRFFESNLSRLPEWCNHESDEDLKLPFCQIRGKYRMELPEYNTLEPYPHMNERCPSMPPKYTRPIHC